MKKLFAGFLAVALVGCSPRDADDSTPPPVAAASPAPKPGDWMWKKPDAKKDGWALDSKGALKSNGNPLNINDDPLNQKAKSSR